MKKSTILIFILLSIVSCQNETKKFETEKLISGAYYVESVPKDETGSLIIFSENGIHYFRKEGINYNYAANFKYYIKGDHIFTCLPYVMNCEKDGFDDHYQIISIDTINDEQVIKLKSTPYILTLKKTISYTYQ